MVQWLLNLGHGVEKYVFISKIYTCKTVLSCLWWQHQYFNLPGADSSDKQYSFSDLGPLQYSPLFSGAGLEQSLFLMRSPIPQVFVHCVQGSHVAHIPDTA